MKRFYEYLCVFAAVMTIGIQCSRTSSIAGNTSSETTNGITASVYESNGDPTQGAVVRLRKIDYVTQPPLSLAKPTIYEADALTDELGRFEFKGIDPGTYSIEVYDSSTGSGHGNNVLFTCSIAANDTLVLAPDTVRPFAVVTGSIDMSTISGALYVQIVGLERLVRVDSTGAFSIRDLPAGHFVLHSIATQGTQTTLVRTDSITVAAGDSVITSMPGWDFSRKVYLNTTATGANVSGNVSNFPVLVRLTNSNFDFSRAKTNGDDLRFTTTNGTAIPFEIERWDASLRSAEIWVKIDTVFGNDSSHYFYMCWGNPSAASVSNSGAVFDTTEGNISVWHLNLVGAGTVKDATQNHYDGVSFNMTAAASVPGIVGGGQAFDGATSYLTFPGTAKSKLDLPEKGTYTVSAWAYTTKLDGNYHIVASKGNLQYNLEVMNTNSWEFAECQSAGGYTDVFSPATSNSWNYLVGVRNGDREYLYVNGLCTDSTITLLDTTYIRNTGDDFTIGKMTNGSNFYFNGMIDEVRVLNRPVSADWIKLCYMNQQSRDFLIAFK